MNRNMQSMIKDAIEEFEILSINKSMRNREIPRKLVINNTEQNILEDTESKDIRMDLRKKRKMFHTPIMRMEDMHLEKIDEEEVADKSHDFSESRAMFQLKEQFKISSDDHANNIL